MTDLLKEAAKHLGKKEHYTYQNIEPDLLVAMPRNQARAHHSLYGIDDSFDGFDKWTCFEFSTLVGGMPIFCLLELWYESCSENIIESKSMKLYLNSWNRHEVNITDKSMPSVLNYVKSRISKDLSDRVRLSLSKIELTQYPTALNLVKTEVPYNVVDFTSDKNLIEGVINVIPGVMSNCMITNQPDWSTLLIQYKKPSSNRLNTDDFLRWLSVFRESNHFHELIHITSQFICNSV